MTTDELAEAYMAFMTRRDENDFPVAAPAAFTLACGSARLAVEAERILAPPMASPDFFGPARTSTTIVVDCELEPSEWALRIPVEALHGPSTYIFDTTTYQTFDHGLTYVKVVEDGTPSAAAWLRERGPTVWVPEGDGWMRTHDCRVRLMLGWTGTADGEPDLGQVSANGATNGNGGQ